MQGRGVPSEDQEGYFWQSLEKPNRCDFRSTLKGGSCRGGVWTQHAEGVCPAKLPGEGWSCSPGTAVERPGLDRAGQCPGTAAGAFSPLYPHPRLHSSGPGEWWPALPPARSPEPSLLDFEGNALGHSDAHGSSQDAVPRDLPLGSVFHHCPEEAGSGGVQQQRREAGQHQCLPVAEACAHPLLPGTQCLMSQEPWSSPTQARASHERVQLT